MQKLQEAKTNVFFLFEAVAWTVLIVSSIGVNVVDSKSKVEWSGTMKSSWQRRQWANMGIAPMQMNHSRGRGGGLTPFDLRGHVR